MKKRICILLICLLLIPSKIYASTNIFDYSDGGGVIHIPKKGRDLSDYDPYEDGYYGYIHVQYQPGGNEDPAAASKQSFIPVIVVNEHILARAQDLGQVLNASTVLSSREVRFSIYSRTLILSADEGEGLFLVRDRETQTDSFYEDVFDLSETPVTYDGSLWVPLQDVCAILEVEMVPLPGQEDDDRILSFIAPQENLFDVFADVMGWNAGRFMTQETDDHYARNSIESRSFLLLNNLTKWDYIWYNVCLNSEIFSSNSRRSENQWDRIMSEAVLYRLIVPNDSEGIQAAQKVKDTFMTMASAVIDNKTALKQKEIVDLAQQLQKVESYGYTTFNPRLFAYKARKIAKLKVDIEAGGKQLKQLNKSNVNYSLASVGISAGLSFLYYKSMFDHADDMILRSMEKMTAESQHNYLSDAAIGRLQKSVRSIRSNLTGHAVGKSLLDTLTSEGPDLILGALSAKAALVSGLLKAALNFNPAYKELADMKEDYSVYQFTLMMQNETNDYMQSALEYAGAHPNNETAVKDAADACYLYLKVCNLAREAAVGSGLVNEEEVEERQTAISNDIADLTANYDLMPMSDGDKRLEIRNNQRDLIRTYVIPMYASINGEVREEVSQELVEDAAGEIQINDETYGTFDNIPGGKYESVCIVLDYPEGTKSSVSRKVDFQAVFSSEKLKAKDALAESVTGGSSYLVSTAYLGGIKVTGQVRDAETKKGLSTVTVTCHVGKVHFRTTTNSSGRFTFEGVKRGHTSFEFQKEGYKPTATAIELGDKEEVALDTIYMETGNFGNFYGYAYAKGAEGEPNTIAKDTRLYLYDENRELKYDFDQNGGDQFSLSVEPGTYIVRCISSLGEAIEEFTVPKDEVVEANILLGDPGKVRYDYIVASTTAGGTWYEGVKGSLSASIMSIGASMEFEYGLNVTTRDPADPMNVTAEGSGYFGQGGFNIDYEVEYDGSQSTYTYSAFGLPMDDETVDMDPGLCHLEQITDSMLDDAEILDDFSFSMQLDQAQIQDLKINPLTISQDLTELGLTEGTLYVYMTDDLKIDVILLEAIGEADYDGVYGQVDLSINYGFAEEPFNWN